LLMVFVKIIISASCKIQDLRRKVQLVMVGYQI
jgi:hypothetical protein